MDLTAAMCCEAAREPVSGKGGRGKERGEEKSGEERRGGEEKRGEGAGQGRAGQGGRCAVQAHIMRGHPLHPSKRKIKGNVTFYF